MEKFDAKDKKILFALDKNSRISYAQLEREVGLRQETIRYRIARLQKEGVIAKFQTILDASKLGIAYYKIFFRLQNMTIARKQEFKKFLTDCDCSTWVCETDGVYDVGVNVLVRSINDLNNFLSNVLSKYANNIMEKSISVNLEGQYFNRDYLLNITRKSLIGKGYKAATQPVQIDKIDFEILKLLCQDARLSCVDIGTRLDVSHDVVLQRLRKLEQHKVITAYTIVLNNERIGRLNYKVLLYLKYFSRERIAQFYSYLQSLNQITYVVKALGHWDIDFEIEAATVQEYRDIMLDIMNRFSDIIKTYFGLLTYNFTKYTYLPQSYKYEEYVGKENTKISQ